MKYLPIMILVIVAFLGGIAVKGQNITISVNPTPLPSLTPTLTQTLTPTASSAPLPTNTPIPQPTKIVQKSKCTKEKTDAFRALAKAAGFSDDLIDAYIKAREANNCEPLPPEQQKMFPDTTRCSPDYTGGFTCRNY